MLNWQSIFMILKQTVNQNHCSEPKGIISNNMLDASNISLSESSSASYCCRCCLVNDVIQVHI